MLLSCGRQILFIHIQRTGGSTIDEIVRRRVPDARRYLGTHDPASRAREALGRDYASFFTFAFVRNPWERLVSWYATIREQAAAVHHSRRNRLWQYVLDNSSSFDEFICHCTAVVDDVDGRKSFLYNQHDYIADEHGTIIVDFVGRYENYRTDLMKLLQRIGVSDVAVPHANASAHRHYSAYYTRRTRDIVADRYRRDIAAFGYSFEERRNG